MFRCPTAQTDKTELIPTMACHMIASLSFLYENFAFWTPFPLFELKLKILITRSFM